jgi:hypothetical protein
LAKITNIRQQRRIVIASRKDRTEGQHKQGKHMIIKWPANLSRTRNKGTKQNPKSPEVAQAVRQRQGCRCRHFSKRHAHPLIATPWKCSVPSKWKSPKTIPSNLIYQSSGTMVSTAPTSSEDGYRPSLMLTAAVATTSCAVTADCDMAWVASVIPGKPTNLGRDGA